MTFHLNIIQGPRRTVAVKNRDASATGGGFFLEFSRPFVTRELGDTVCPPYLHSSIHSQHIIHFEFVCCPATGTLHPTPPVAFHWINFPIVERELRRGFCWQLCECPEVRIYPNYCNNVRVADHERTGSRYDNTHYPNDPTILACSPRLSLICLHSVRAMQTRIHLFTSYFHLSDLGQPGVLTDQESGPTGS